MGITRAAALDCAPYRVHVNAICPGCECSGSRMMRFFLEWGNTDAAVDIKTPMTERIWGVHERTEAVTALHPFRGVGTAEDVAPIAVFLASEDARWVTGTGISVDGGYTTQ